MTAPVASVAASVPVATPLLDVEDLTCHIETPRGVVRAVDGVSFRLEVGQSLGIAGESGSGKSMTALSLLRLFGPRTRCRLGGRVRFEGVDLLRASEGELRQVRGGRIGLVFQDPLTSLDPVMPVGDQIAEPLRVHAGLRRGPARARAVELLDLVGIPDPHRVAGDLPHRFSGGMRQRILIAAAVACEPKLLIADEATTALDVTVQAQILSLLARLRRELGMALMVISHDLGVISALADTMQVMYAGRIVERGPVGDLLADAAHPYTRALVRLVPRLDQTTHAKRLRPIPGSPPTPTGAPDGCRFRARCDAAHDRCADEPELEPFAPARERACWAPLDALGVEPPLTAHESNDALVPEPTDLARGAEPAEPTAGARPADDRSPVRPADPTIQGPTPTGRGAR